MLPELIPERLHKVPELMSVINAEEPEAEAALDAVIDFLAQLNVDSATWGLDLWEYQYGIPTNHTKSMQARRSVLKAKMRGTATTTVEQIRRVINAYTGNDSCEVTEYPSKYFVSVSYELPNQLLEVADDCRTSLRIILPAHIGFEQCIIAPVMHSTLYFGGTLVPSYHETNLPQYQPSKTLHTQAGINGAMGSIVTIKLPPLKAKGE